jgi:uncharacterized protein (DUF58 family)
MLLAAAAFISILYNQYYIGIIFLTIVAMPFLMFGLLCYIYGNVKAELISSAHVVSKGEAIPISVQLKNPTIFPISNLKIYLVYKNAYSAQRYTKDFLVSVDGRTKTTVICNLFSDYAGNMEISLKAIRIYDYLKLFSLKRKQKGEVKAAVLPYYYELSEDYDFGRHTRIIESDYYSPYKSGDDPSEVFAIREYREGDRLSRIHWKLSRKLDQLMIKEFSDPMNCSVLLFVNLCVPEGESVLYYIDAMLECALSISFTFLTKGQMHYFAWYDREHGICRRIRVSKEKDLFEAVDGLLQARPFGRETDALSAYLAEHPNDQYTDLLYVTGEVSLTNLDALSIIKSQTRQLIYVNDIDNLLGNHDIPAELMGKTAEMGIDLWPVDVTNVRRDIEQMRMA